MAGVGGPVGLGMEVGSCSSPVCHGLASPVTRSLDEMPSKKERRKAKKSELEGNRVAFERARTNKFECCCCYEPSCHYVGGNLLEYGFTCPFGHVICFMCWLNLNNEQVEMHICCTANGGPVGLKTSSSKSSMDTPGNARCAECPCSVHGGSQAALSMRVV